MSKINDDNINYLEGIRNSDPTAVKAIYKNFLKPITHLVEANRGTKDDALDVFQEGLVTLFQKAQDPDFQINSSFLTYFYSVCRNIWSNKQRKKVNQEVTIDDTMLLMFGDDNPDPANELNERYFLYRKMFLRLGGDCQKILSLFLEKVSMEEITIIMGYSSVGYTKKRKFECKEKLILLIQQDPQFRELKTEND
jgi:RNA polymerase sigma factor (sigma-70 family)